jgi:hypothetical protein
MDNNGHHSEVSPSPSTAGLVSLLAALGDPEATKQKALAQDARDRGQDGRDREQDARETALNEREAAIAGKEAAVLERYNYHSGKAAELDAKVLAFEETRVALAHHVAVAEAKVNRALGDTGGGVPEGSGMGQSRASEFASWDPRVVDHLKRIFRDFPDRDPDPAPAPRDPRLAREGFMGGTTITRAVDVPLLIVEPQPARQPARLRHGRI